MPLEGTPERRCTKTLSTPFPRFVTEDDPAFHAPPPPLDWDEDSESEGDADEHDELAAAEGDSGASSESDGDTGSRPSGGATDR